MADLIILFVAAFGAGVVNSIAGGGTFLTFPALVWVGVPPIVANATSALAVLPGYLSAALGFRREVREIAPQDLRHALIVSLLGGLAGGVLLLVSSEDVFAVIVPFLLLGATLIFAFQAPIQNLMRQSRFKVSPFGSAGLFIVATYGGYFNGGLGIVLLALFALWGMDNLNRMNGLKTALSFVISVVSVATFAVAGLILWKEGALMMVGAILGGYAGAGLARVLPASIVRFTITLIGLGMSAVFFARL